MSFSSRFPWTLTLCLGLSITLSACNRDTGNIDSDTPVLEGRPVKILTVKEANKSRVLKLPAVIQASSSAEMAFQIGGKLDKPLIKEGTEVTQGTELARLEQQEFKDRLDSAQAQYDAAKDEYDRTKSLIKTNAVSKSMLEQRRTQYEVARASLNTAKKSFNDSIMRAPFDGVVSQVNVEAFQTVGPQQIILTLQSVGLSDAIIQVPADLVIRSKSYDMKNLRVQLDAAPGVSIPGTLGPYMATTESGSQSYQVKIHFMPPEDLIVLPGMTGEVSMEVVAAHQSTDSAVPLGVPLNAVASDGKGQFVWRIDTENMTAHRQDVVIAPESVGEQLAVIEGLKSGDQIIVSGVNYLFEGMPVRVFNP